MPCVRATHSLRSKLGTGVPWVSFAPALRLRVVARCVVAPLVRLGFQPALRQGFEAIDVCALDPPETLSVRNLSLLVGPDAAGHPFTDRLVCVTGGAPCRAVPALAHWCRVHERRQLLCIASGLVCPSPHPAFEGSCHMLRVAPFALCVQCLHSSPRAARGGVLFFTLTHQHAHILASLRSFHQSGRVRRPLLSVDRSLFRKLDHSTEHPVNCVGPTG